MTKKADAGRALVREWVQANGYKEDRWGNWVQERPHQPTGELRRYRYKFGRTSVRYEVFNANINSWVRLLSGYYKDLALIDGKILKGMSSL